MQAGDACAFPTSVVMLEGTNGVQSNQLVSFKPQNEVHSNVLHRSSVSTDQVP